MKAADTFRLVFNSMKYKRLRTILTVIGILVGPAAIVALLSITSGVTGSITSQLDKIGVTTIYVSASGSTGLTPSTVSEIGKLANITAVVPFYSFSGSIQGNSSETVTVYALNVSALQKILPSLSLMEGSTAQSAASAAIGYSVAYPNVTGEPNITVGKALTVDISKGSSGFGFSGFGSGSSKARTSAYSFIVSGVYSKFGQGMFISPDTSIFVPLSEGINIKQSSNYTGVFITVKNASSVTGTVGALEALLGNKARVTAVSSLLSSIESIEGSVSTLLIGIAGISLIVAFMSIMTTMFTAVTERTKEIGVMKALGAKSKQILALFVTESLMLGLIGGAIGSVAGAAVGYFGAPMLTAMTSMHSSTASAQTSAKSSAHMQQRSSSFAYAGAPGGNGFAFAGGSSSASMASSIKGTIDPKLMLEVIALTAALGALAGFVPAWKAARLPPADALRAL